MIRYILVLGMLCTVQINVCGQDIELVKNIADELNIQFPSSSFPLDFADLDGTLYFSARDNINGSELWKSDGTAEGTVLVKDISPGSSGGGPRDLVNVGGTLYFSADDGVNGSELWKSDGTAEGTVLVKDIFEGTFGSSTRNLTNVDGTLYFSARGETTDGFELWKSDGTAEGTVLVKDIFPGNGSSSPRELTDFGGTLYFTADDGVNGSELWKSDGTAEGTVLVKDISPGNSFSGPSGSDPSDLVNYKGTLYFSAFDNTNGTELWKSDGTAEGTVLVKDIAAGSRSSRVEGLADVGGTLYFSANDGVNGTELWKSDGTAEGTVLVKDIFPGNGRSSPRELADLGGTLYFSADDGVNGRELWKSDGTAEGTVIVKDILSGGNSSEPRELADTGGTLYFSANDGISGIELWKSDGTAEGTVLVKDINPSSKDSSPEQLTNVGRTLYFSTRNLRGLWKSDGTAEGTVLVKDIPTGNLTDVGGTLYFSADDGVNGSELWKSDGTAEGTVLVKDILPGDDRNEPRSLVDFGGTLYFSADDGENGYELWKSDGTAEGTVLVKDIIPGSLSSIPAELTDVEGTLYFVAGDSENGRELWKSDGTAEGTVLVKDILPGNGGSNPSRLVSYRGTLYFSANDGINGIEIWKSDGTAEGTVLVKDIIPGASSFPAELTDVAGTLYFSVFDGVNSRKLWKSDGTAEGTEQFIDLRPGIQTGQRFGITDVRGTLYFVANDGINGEEVWKSDGTTSGTVIVSDVNATNIGNYTNLTAVGSTLYLSAFELNTGQELYKLETKTDQDECTPPVLASQDITVALDENGVASITAEQLLDEANSQIGCGYEPENLTIDKSDFGCEDVGEVTVNLSLVDNNGNQASTTATVTVENPAPKVRDGDIQETLPVDPLLVNSSFSLSANITDVNAVSAVWEWENTTEMSSGSKEGNIENGTASVNLSLANPGLYTITLTVTDVCGEEGTYPYDGLVVVYDPSAGFVTGGGWIDTPSGSYIADPGLSGKANFGFESKYKKKADVPTGNLTFHFKPAKLKFKASNQEWLVISGDVVIFRGSGKIRGKKGVFEYLLVGKDQKPDAFCLMIWNEEEVVFDNQPGAAITDLMATQLGGGSIVIHQRNKNARSLDDEKPLAAEFSESPTDPGSFSFDYRSYPNPVLDDLNLHIQSETDEEVSFKVYDMMGRLLHESQHQVSEGANHLILNTGRWKQQKGKLLLQMESPSRGIRSINILKK